MLESNPGKNVDIEVNGSIYSRYAIKTHYITVGESLIDIVEKYVKEDYESDDFISISEKIVSLCQNRILFKKDIKLSFMAKFLSKFVNVTPAGEAVGNPYKMQIAIMLCGKFKVLWAAICAGFGKIFKKKGIFYEMLGYEVAGIDGFCDDAFKDYLDMAILLPKDPVGVCNEIYEKLGIKTMIVDANDLNVEILGKSDTLDISYEDLAKIIKDNPTGQENQQTPVILIKKQEKLLQEDKEIMEDITNYETTEEIEGTNIDSYDETEVDVNKDTNIDEV